MIAFSLLFIELLHVIAGTRVHTATMIETCGNWKLFYDSQMQHITDQFGDVVIDIMHLVAAGIGVNKLWKDNFNRSAASSEWQFTV